MFKKRVIAAAACALAMAGAAHAVQVNPEGTGDFLIAPAYFIGGDMSTNLKVINTSKTQSVVAKVIFRHPVTSAEMLDFLVYLSPSDVWNGTVSCQAADAAGTCVKSVITSADDSIQLENSATFATAENPAHIVSEGDAGTTGRTALANQGYIEVVMSSAYNVFPNRPGVKKTDIVTAHEAAGVQVGVNATPNVLTGSVTAVAPGLGAATLPMLALADFDNAVKLQVGGNTGLDGGGQRTSVFDVEEALWTNNLAVPYAIGADKLSLVTFTFPTKLTYNDVVPQPGQPLVVDGQYPFTPKGQVCVNIGEVFDNSENSLGLNVSPLPAPKCVDEFQWLQFGSDIKTGVFTDGWARLSFVGAQVAQQQNPNAIPANHNRNVGRVGVPAIVTYMQKDTAAGKFTWAYASGARD